jgi:REP element-mobilizing transposase RayT
MDQYRSLSHTKWECKYHVIFIPKCRRKTLYGQLRQHLGEVFRNLAGRKESRIEEGHLMPDPVHVLIAISPKFAVSQVVGRRVYQGQERHPFGSGVWREETQFRRPAFLGTRLFRIDRRQGGDGDSGLHPTPGRGGPPFGSVSNQQQSWWLLTRSGSSSNS